MARIHDDENARYIFDMTDTDLLLQIAKGEIDPIQLAKDQLAARGIGKDGQWVGFDRAKTYWQKTYQSSNGKRVTIPED